MNADRAGSKGPALFFLLGAVLTGDGMKKKIIFSAVMTVLILFVAWGVLEVVFRILPESLSPKVTRDASTVWFVPELPQVHMWTDGRTNLLKVAVVGDSITKGHGVQYYDYYGARLEWLLNLNTGTPPAEVEGFAIAGTSPSQQFPLVKKALAWGAQVVVLGICLNDAEDHSRKEELLKWRDRMLVRTPPRLLAPLIRHSRFLNRLYLRLEQARVRRAYFAYNDFIYNPEYSGWNHLRKSIKIMKKMCEDQGVKFAAILFPAMGESDYPVYPFQKQHDQIGEMVRAIGIPYLDLLPAFRFKDSRRMQVIPGIDGHPSEIAHRLIAENLFAFLLEQKLIDPSYTPHNLAQDDLVTKIWSRMIENRELAR